MAAITNVTNRRSMTLNGALDYTVLPVYNKLQPGQIRLLTIAHARCDDTRDSVDVVLETYHIGDSLKAPYLALSYCWGTPAKKSQISINGTTVPITDSLSRALPYLEDIEKRERVTRWWIDAICINQADLEERRQQVLMMRDVFSCAVTTIIWLGEPGVDGNLLDCIEALTETPSHNSALHPTCRDSDVSKPRRRLTALLQLPYFERLWMVQENSASAQVLVYLGTQQVPRQHIVHVCRKAFIGYIDGVENSEINMPLLLRRALSLLEPKQDQPLWHLLCHFRGLECSDARDKILALISICAEQKTNPIALYGYGAPISAHYTQLVYLLISRTQSLSILSCVQGQRRHPLHNESGSDGAFEQRLPSWAPDWRLPWKAAILDPQFANVKAGPSFRASKSSTPPVTDSYSDTRLYVQGYTIDSISAVFKLTTDQIQNMVASMNTVLSALLDKPSERVNRHLNEFYIRTRESYAQALIRTLSVDSIQLKRDLTSSMLNPSVDSPELYFTPRQLKRWADLNVTSNQGTFLPWVGGPGHVATIFNGPQLLNEDFDFTIQAINHIKNLHIGRTAFLTERGYLGLGPEDVRKGDTVHIFLGGDVPFVLDRVSGNEYQLVGECYLHGFMDGAILTEREGIEECEEFILL